ncbi:uncharacterized protein YecT (DUF1311 family) [Rhodobacteraceae bacterium MBR-64]
MKRWLQAFAVMLSTLPGAAMAQQGAYGQAQVDPAPVRACYQAARPADRGVPACAGDAARACQARPGGDTTLGISECLMAETAVWDDLMRGALAQQAQTLGQNDPALPPQLTAAQNDWAAYRDADCGLRYAIWLTGSIRTIIAADCHLAKTAQRAVELRYLGGAE